VERWLTKVGLALCGLVVAGTVVLLGVRLVAGPRTVHHDACPGSRPPSGCVHDRYSGNVVSRPWMVLFGTLSVCAVAIGAALREHHRALSSA
jgi:hypothetical protein